MDHADWRDREENGMTRLFQDDGRHVPSPS
jgi:hypothetical protein